MALLKMDAGMLHSQLEVERVNLAFTSIDANTSAIAVIHNVTAPASAFTIPTGVSFVAATTGTQTLYAASAFPGGHVTVKNVGTGELTVASADNIDGEATQIIAVQYGAIALKSDGSTWWIV